MTLRDELATIVAEPNCRAFLSAIRFGEGTSGPNGYRTMFGGGLFDSFSDHPRQIVTRTLGGRPLSSTAAGAYQFLSRTWDECAAALGLPDFTPESQDLAALFLIRRRGALAEVREGKVSEAVEKCAKEWASLPGSPYGQPTVSLAKFLALYAFAGGSMGVSLSGAPIAVLRPDPEPASTVPSSSKESKMAIPLLFPIIAELATQIPAIAKLFGIGTASPVAQRNVAAAELAVSVVTKAVGATNAQDALEKISSSPAAKALATKAIEASYYELKEIGGGVEAAHKRNIATAAMPHGGLTSPAFIVTILLMIPINFAVAVVLWPGSEYSQDIKLMVVTALVTGVIGVISGYWLGTSASSSRKTELADQKLSQPPILS